MSRLYSMKTQNKKQHQVADENNDTQREELDELLEEYSGPLLGVLGNEAHYSYGYGN